MDELDLSLQWFFFLSNLGLVTNSIERSGRIWSSWLPSSWIFANMCLMTIALSDTQIDSIQCLNFAQNWFNSIFDSKSFHENSIQKIIQFLIIFVIQFSILFNSKWVILIQFNRLFNLKWKITIFTQDMDFNQF